MGLEAAINRVINVTSGTGKATAELLAATGYRVIVPSRVPPGRRYAATNSCPAT